MIEALEQMTPRESVLLEREDRELANARNHELTVKKLELTERYKLKEAELHAQVRLKELEVQLKQQEAKLRRIPLLILKLPMAPFIGLAVVFTSLLRREAPQALLDFLR